jgi:hypothetical protein
LKVLEEELEKNYIETFEQATLEQTTWKWRTNTQKFIQKYLNFLCEGGSKEIPKHFLAWSSKARLEKTQKFNDMKELKNGSHRRHFILLNEIKKKKQ